MLLDELMYMVQIDTRSECTFQLHEVEIAKKIHLREHRVCTLPAESTER